MSSDLKTFAIGVGAGIAIGYGISKVMGNTSEKSSTKSTPSGTFDLGTLVRPNIAALKPYRCARDDYDSGVLLDANENAYGPAIANNEQVLERYPCPYQWALKDVVAKRRGVKKENVFVGVGSDEAIDMLIRIFCAPTKDSILICQPTYGMYSVSADTNDVGIVDIPQTTDFQLQTQKVLDTARANSSIKLMFLCSPGNPSCALLNRADIITILETRLQCMVVVDEAYIDFAGLCHRSHTCACIQASQVWLLSLELFDWMLLY
jgi:histidinol-phosphate aminotransferase